MGKPENELSVTIASPPDRENLVAELWWGDEQWGELSNEHGSIVIEIYPQRSGKPWSFSFEDVEKILKKAKERLVG